MNPYQPYRFQILPTVVKNLLIINGLMFLLNLVAENWGIDINQHLGLYYFNSPFFRPWQIVTHIFMHGNFTHLLSNMFALWMFGSMVENYWGPKRFLTYYLITALGAAILYTGVNWWEISQLQTKMNLALELHDGYSFQTLRQVYLEKLGTPVVGASGAVFGILVAFGMMFPNTLIYVYFAIPIKAKYLVIIYAALELFLGLQNNPADNVAHFAHLGGALFGFLLILYWKRFGKNRFY